MSVHVILIAQLEGIDDMGLCIMCVGKAKTYHE